jgi:DNA-directed RNA polymerase specialized sigma24 family protein
MQYPSAWTYRVALNGRRKTARRRFREAALAVSATESVPKGPPMACPEVWDAGRALPARQRAAIVLRDVADLTEDVIAVVLGVTRGTVASTLSRARTALAAPLAEDPTCTGGDR